MLKNFRSRTQIGILEDLAQSIKTPYYKHKGIVQMHIHWFQNFLFMALVNVHVWITVLLTKETKHECSHLKYAENTWLNSYPFPKVQPTNWWVRHGLWLEVKSKMNEAELCIHPWRFFWKWGGSESPSICYRTHHRMQTEFLIKIWLLSQG